MNTMGKPMPIDSVRDIISMFREQNPSVPLQYVEAFLVVAEEEGLGVADYAKKLGTPWSVMARCFLKIGERSPLDRAGLGWVRQELNRVLLTPKGKEMRERVHYA